MFHPKGPNNLLSCTTAWKKERPNSSFLCSAGLEVALIASLFSLKYALRRLARRPEGERVGRDGGGRVWKEKERRWVRGDGQKEGMGGVKEEDEGGIAGSQLQAK
jgi:hypothetical protein